MPKDRAVHCQPPLRQLVHCRPMSTAFALLLLAAYSQAADKVRCKVTLAPRAMQVEFDYPKSAVTKPTLQLGDWAGGQELPGRHLFLQSLGRPGPRASRNEAVRI